MTHINRYTSLEEFNNAKDSLETPQVAIINSIGVAYKRTEETDWAVHNGTKEFIIMIPNNEIWYTAISKLPELEDEEEAEWGTEGVYLNGFNTTITSHTFENSEGVITFLEDITSINEWAFSFCQGLTSITIPNSVTSIGCRAFYDCTGLTSITIPNSVTSIDEDAFIDCTSLTTIEVKASTPPSIIFNSFSSKFLIAIYVRAGSVETYKADTNWSRFTDKIQAI